MSDHHQRRPSPVHVLSKLLPQLYPEEERVLAVRELATKLWLQAADAVGAGVAVGDARNRRAQ